MVRKDDPEIEAQLSAAEQALVAAPASRQARTTG
jgi:hypothetical protein